MVIPFCAIDMGKRKNRIGRLHKNYEKKRQSLKRNPPGRPPKRKMKKVKTTFKTSDHELIMTSGIILLYFAE